MGYWSICSLGCSKHPEVCWIWLWSLLYGGNSQRARICQSSFFHHLLQWASFLARGTARSRQCAGTGMCWHRSQGPWLLPHVLVTLGQAQLCSHRVELSASCSQTLDCPAATSVQAAKQPVLLSIRSISIVVGGIVRNDLWHTWTARVQWWKSAHEKVALQEAPDSLYLDIFFPYIITSNIRFFGRSCYICSYTLCFTKPRFWSDNFAQFSTACSLTYVFPHNFSQRLNALVILQYVYFYITMSVVEPQMNTLGYSIQAYIEHVCTYTNGRTRHRRKALRNTTRN